MKPDQKRWFILFAGILANLCQGAAYASSVLAGPLMKYLNLGQMMADGKFKPDMPKWALVFSLNLAMLPVGMLLSGKIADQKSPKLIVFIGALLFGGGVFLAGYTHSMNWFYGTFGILAGLGSGAAYGAIVSTVVRWFPDRRGLASGLAVGALGFGPVVIVPVVNMLHPEEHIMLVFQVLGAAFLVIMSLASLVMVNPPKGYVPANFTPKTPAQGSTSGIDLTWTQMLGKSRFWLLYLLYVCGAFSGLMFTSQAKQIVMGMQETGLDPKSLGIFAGKIVMVIAISNATGRVLWGTISDWIGRQWALVLMFLITAIGMFMMPKLAAETGTIVVGAVLIGACFGGYLGTFPPICADSFGGRNMAVNYALLFSAFAVAAIIGPGVAAGIQKATGSYNPAFMRAGAVASLGFVVALGMALSKPKSS